MNKKKYIVIGIYILINLLVALLSLLSGNVKYFGDSAAITTIAIGVIYRLFPQLLNIKTDKATCLYIYPIAIGILLLLFVHVVMH